MTSPFTAAMSKAAQDAIAAQVAMTAAAKAAVDSGRAATAASATPPPMAEPPAPTAKEA